MPENNSISHSNNNNGNDDGHTTNYTHNTCDDIERTLLSINSPADNCKLLHKPLNDADKSEQINHSLNQIREKHRYNLRDINAMSIASIYDKENNEIIDMEK